MEQILGLCEREKPVYKLRAQQKTIDEIVSETRLSRNTVKDYSSAVFKKVKKAGFRSAAECALKTGYLLQLFYCLFSDTLNAVINSLVFFPG
ncbi:MAG: hypothetical protein ABI855_16665 [Bacteroidota bacterium]